MRHTPVLFLLLTMFSPASAEFRVDSDFPGGNIQVQRVEGDTVFVAPNQRDTQQGQWWFDWNFRLRVPAAQPVRPCSL